MGGKILELHSEKMEKKGRKIVRAEGLAKGQAVGRAKGQAEERKIGIRTLIIILKDLSIDQPKVVEQLMKNYSLTHDQAQAAVQANW